MFATVVVQWDVQCSRHNCSMAYAGNMKFCKPVLLVVL